MRPTALTAKERRLIERHPEIGARLVEPLGISTEISAVIRHHHEWWDGRGYPDGLYGEQIPLVARIVAGPLTDVSHEKASIQPAFLHPRKINLVEYETPELFILRSLA